jgi:hypothetical protein
MKFEGDPGHAWMWSKFAFEAPNQDLTVIRITPVPGHNSILKLRKQDLTVIRVTPISGQNLILKLQKAFFYREPGHACIRSKFDFEAPRNKL